MQMQVQKLITKLFRRSGLRERLVSSGRTRWLDVGSQIFEEGFMCLDMGDLKPGGPPDRYFQANLLAMKDEDFERMGTFDLVRMQHVLEHFDFREGQSVLQTCGRLLRPDGYLLISVPDLRKHILGYLGAYSRLQQNYVSFARSSGVPDGAPHSLVFSIFTHQMGEHKWCYDDKGLLYALRQAGCFRDEKILWLLDPLAGIPFTHNRPREDVCVLARKAAT